MWNYNHLLISYSVTVGSSCKQWNARRRGAALATGHGFNQHCKLHLSLRAVILGVRSGSGLGQWTILFD